MILHQRCLRSYIRTSTELMSQGWKRVLTKPKRYQCTNPQKHFIENSHYLHCNQLTGILGGLFTSHTHVYKTHITSWTNKMRGTIWAKAQWKFIQVLSYPDLILHASSVFDNATGCQKCCWGILDLQGPRGLRVGLQGPRGARYRLTGSLGSRVLGGQGVGLQGPRGSRNRLIGSQRVKG